MPGSVILDPATLAISLNHHRGQVEDVRTGQKEQKPNHKGTEDQQGLREARDRITDNSAGCWEIWVVTAGGTAYHHSRMGRHNCHPWGPLASFHSQKKANLWGIGQGGS